MEPQKLKNKQRAHDIIRQLSQHGPISTTILNRMLETSMTSKKLCNSLYRLRDKGLVDSRIMGNPSHRAVFWQVSKDFLSEPTSQVIFQYDRDNLLKLRTSRRCLYSHGVRQYWLYVLGRVLPQAEVVRRDQIAGHAEARRVMRLDERREKIAARLPDFLFRCE